MSDTDVSPSSPTARGAEIAARVSGQLRRFTAGDGRFWTPGGVLLMLAIIYTIYFARALLLPVTVAGLTALLLSPVVETLERARIPRTLGSFMALTALAAAVGGAIWGLSGPLERYVDRAPQMIDQLRGKTGELQKIH